MKKLLILFFLPSIVLADRLGSLGSNTQVLLSTQAITRSSFSATQPIVYNSATGAFGATPISLSTGIVGILPLANGGNGTASPSLVAGTNVTITGTFPNQTINSSGGGGGSGLTYSSFTATQPIVYNNSTGAFGLTPISLSTGVVNVLPVANGGSGTASPSIVPGTNITVTGTWPNQTVNSTASGSGGLPLPSGATNYIQVSNTLQSGSTFYVSSGTVQNLNSSLITVNGSGDSVITGTIAGSSYSVPFSSASVTAGHLALWSTTSYTLIDGGVPSAGGGGGGSSLPLPAGATNYIQVSNALQTGSTFYVSSATVANYFQIVSTNNAQTLQVRHTTLPSGGGFGPQTANTFIYNKQIDDSQSGNLAIVASTIPYSSFSNGSTVDQMGTAITLRANSGSVPGVGDIAFGLKGIGNVVTISTGAVNLLIGTGITLNSSYGTSGQVLTSGGVGQADTWTTVSGGGGTPGGSNNQMQYNNAGAFGGTPIMTVDASSVTVTVSSAVWSGFNAMVFQSGTAIDATAADYFHLPTRTIAQLKALAPTQVGDPYYCSDCSNSLVCISTGTATFGFAQLNASNRTTACQ